MLMWGAMVAAVILPTSGKRRRVINVYRVRPVKHHILVKVVHELAALLGGKNSVEGVVCAVDVRPEPTLWMYSRS